MAGALVWQITCFIALTVYKLSRPSALVDTLILNSRFTKQSKICAVPCFCNRNRRLWSIVQTFIAKLDLSRWPGISRHGGGDLADKVDVSGLVGMTNLLPNYFRTASMRFAKGGVEYTCHGVDVGPGTMEGRRSYHRHRPKCSSTCIEYRGFGGRREGVARDNGW